MAVRAYEACAFEFIDVLDLYAAGLTAEPILEEMPDLEVEDLAAALKYAARRLDHPVIAA